MQDLLYIYEMWKSQLVFPSNFLWRIFTLLINLCNFCSLVIVLVNQLQKVFPQNYGFTINYRRGLNHNLVITDLALPPLAGDN
jgi:hypothetical protein